MSAAHSRDSSRRITIETPEQVSLSFELAGVAERFGAFVLDTLIVFVVLIAASLAISLTIGSASRALGAAAVQVISFLLWNFYFVFFEARHQGRTPGKRVVGIRVIDNRGGPLTTSAVFARNVTRDVELLFPLVFLVVPSALFPNGAVWSRYIAGAWLLVFLLFPLFNRHRLRIGDTIAGTIVVRSPRAMLMADLGGMTQQQQARRPRYVFTPQQLNVYGIYELQVLESVLRSPEAADPGSVITICDRIKTKIRWNRDLWQVEPYQFLHDFYTAQRAHLEERMLMGERREFKQQ